MGEPPQTSLREAPQTRGEYGLEALPPQDRKPSAAEDGTGGTGTGTGGTGTGTGGTGTGTGGTGTGGTGLAGRGRAWRAAQIPPSTFNVTPETKLAWSLARNSATSAISSGLPSRLSAARPE